ncbi:MAG: CHAT domain-containing protein [Herpetosiphonaceae bacterium]|nr:CHAT domain-containing protein [Herpetosiphonaceae bacterium]
MTINLKVDDLSLLSLCAILRRFDGDLLQSFASFDASALTELLASDRVVPVPELPGSFQVREDVWTDVLARLRAEHPDDELMLHEEAFVRFLQRLQDDPSIPERRDHEERCFYHLEALRVPLIERREWERIRHYVAVLRAARPQAQRHLHLLSLYDGFDALHIPNYEVGEAILSTLVADPSLADDIRMRAFNMLAQIHWFQTQYDQALEFYRQVHILAGVTTNPTFQAHALLNMSMVYHEIGYYIQALELSEQSLHAYQALDDTYHEAHAHYEVGKNAIQLGRWQDAQHHLDAADVIYVRLGVESQLANLYCLRAQLHHALGDEVESKMWYLRSLEIGRSQQHGDPAVTMDAWLLLGFLYQTQEHWSEALAAYEQAATIAAGLRNTHSLALTHFRCGEVYKVQGLTHAAANAYRKAIDLLETLRGAAAGEEVKLGLLGATQQIYEATILLLLEQGRHAEAYHFVQRARARAFLDMLAQKSPELYASFDQPVATLAEIQAHLPKDAVLVEYFTTGVLPRGDSLINRLPLNNARLRKHLTTRPSILIFVVTHDGLEIYRPLLDPNTLRPLPHDAGPSRRLLERPRLLTELHKRLIAPFQHVLQDRQLLYLIPHGPLHYVPFLALCSASGEFLLDRSGPAVAMVPSATILLRNCLACPRGRGRGLLAVGYNGVGERELRYAEVEARAIARLLGGEAWTGPQRKTDSLIEPARHACWLHFAGHAVYDPQDPLNSALQLGEDEALTARTIIGRLNLQADLVTLSACTSGLSHVVPGDELFGLQRAFLYAGVPSVVCTLWEANDLVALLIMELLYTALRAGVPVAAALRDAQVTIREMTGRDLQATITRLHSDNPELAAALNDMIGVQADLDTHLFADPFFWAPFMLIGGPR